MTGRSSIGTSWSRFTPIVLELGSGHIKQAPAGAQVQIIGIDVVNRGAVDVVADLSVSWPIRDRSILGVWSSHCLEHLSWEGSRLALREAHRVLMPGGWWQSYCPDFAVCVADYRQHGLNAEWVWNLVGQQKFPSDFHLSQWDGPVLGQELRKAGFIDISTVRGRQDNELAAFARKPL